jgi:hypothetical protein
VQGAAAETDGVGVLTAQHVHWLQDDGALRGRLSPPAARQRCIDAGIKPSTGTVGDAYDNAMAEKFFSTLEHELLACRPQPIAIHDWHRLNMSGYAGSAAAVRRMARRLDRERGPRAEDVAIRVETVAGESTQVDFVYAGAARHTRAMNYAPSPIQPNYWPPRSPTPLPPLCKRQLLDRRDVAAVLRIPLCAVKSLVTEHDLRVVKIAGYTRFLEIDLRALVERQRPPLPVHSRPGV